MSFKTVELIRAGAVGLRGPFLRMDSFAKSKVLVILGIHAARRVHSSTNVFVFQALRSQLPPLPNTNVHVILTLVGLLPKVHSRVMHLTRVTLFFRAETPVKRK